MPHNEEKVFVELNLKLEASTDFYLMSERDPSTILVRVLVDNNPDDRVRYQAAVAKLSLLLTRLINEE